MERAQAARVAVVGGFNMDLVFSAPRRPEPGETLVGTAFGTFIGGKGANQAVAAARAGAAVEMIGRLGQDTFGRDIARALEHEGASVRHAVRAAEAGAGEAARAARALFQGGVHTVLVTLGERGALLADGAGADLIPSFPVRAVDTTAAGDAFCGALAVALAEGRPLRDAVRFACAAGALAVTVMGAGPSLPRRRDIERL